MDKLFVAKNRSYLRKQSDSLSNKKAFSDRKSSQDSANSVTISGSVIVNSKLCIRIQTRINRKRSKRVDWSSCGRRFAAGVVTRV